MTERAAKREYVALNLLRGLAAFVVLLEHVRSLAFVEYSALPADDRNPLTMAFYALTRGGHAAVLVFFVMSGYLVGGQIIRRLEDGTFSLRSYSVDRISRIFLPLIPACLLTAALNYMFFDIHPDATVLFGNMLGLNGILIPTLPLNPPLWTLAYEIWFYVGGGAVAALFARKNVLASSIGIAVVVATFSVLEARFFLFWSLGAFAILTARQKLIPAQSIVAITLIAAGFVLDQLASESRSFSTAAIASRPVAEAIICIGVFALIPVCCHPRLDEALGWISGLASRLAKISFTLYLFHYPLNVVLADYLPRHAEISALALGDFAMRVVILVAASSALYWLFERNTGAIRSYLNGKARSIPVSGIRA